MRFSPRPVLVAISAGTLLFSACSGSDSSATQTLPAADTALTDGASAAYDDADVVFAQGMIPHHRGAIEMADLALAPSAQAGPEVQALATQIKGAQDPEIAQMTAMLGSWGQPVEMPAMEGMDDMGAMEGAGMMTAEEMASLAALSGAEFDAAWSAAMIIHHEGAIAMAQTVKASGSSPEVATLADAIITGQQAEIDQMKAFVAG